MHHPTDRIAHTTAFVTPVMENWLEREMAQLVHPEGSIRRPIALRGSYYNVREPVLSEAVLTDCRPRSRRSWSTRGRWTPWWTFRTCLDPEPAGHGVGRASCDR